MFAADRRWCQEARCLQQTDVGVRRLGVCSRQTLVSGGWVFAADRRWCQEAGCLQQTDVGVRRQALVSSRQEGEVQNEAGCRRQGVI